MGECRCKWRSQLFIIEEDMTSTSRHEESPSNGIGQVSKESRKMLVDWHDWVVPSEARRRIKLAECPSATDLSGPDLHRG